MARNLLERSGLLLARMPEGATRQDPACNGGRVVQTVVLIASASDYRRLWYRDRLPHSGIGVVVAKSGLECLQMLDTYHPDLVMLETTLLWGGCEGILAIRAENSALQEIPFVLIDIDGVSAMTYRLARYQLQSFLVHMPSIEELVTTIHLIRFGILVNCIEDDELAIWSTEHNFRSETRHAGSESRLTHLPAE